MSSKIPRIDYDSTDDISNLIIDGKYKLLEKLNKGGMGLIFIAEQISINRKVALKMIGGDHQDEEMVAHFFSEAKILGNLQHPNIVNLIDFGKAEDGSLYLVMELLKGKTLAALVREQGALNIEAVIRMGVQISSALAEIHTQQVIHRDIKPDNIFVQNIANNLSTVKLIDFGLGKQIHPDQETTSPDRIIGSPMYMAPEQIENSEVTGQTDIYSLGLTLYYAITGQVPYNEESVSKTVHAQLTKYPLSISDLREDTTEGDDIVRIIQRCINKKNDNRFNDSLALHRALCKAHHHFPSDLDDPIFTEEVQRIKAQEQATKPKYLKPKSVAVMVQIMLAVFVLFSIVLFFYTIR